MIVIISAIAYNYIYKDHRSIKEEQPAFIINSSEIIKEFSVDAIGAENKYLDQTIQVSGIVTELNKDNLTLNNAVFCKFKTLIPTNLKYNNSITIKGRFIGYDDLLEEIKLDQCHIIYNE